MIKAFQIVSHKRCNTISDEKFITLFYDTLGNKIQTITFILSWSEYMFIGPWSKVHSNMGFVSKPPSKKVLLGGVGGDSGEASALFEDPL